LDRETTKRRFKELRDARGKLAGIRKIVAADELVSPLGQIEIMNAVREHWGGDIGGILYLKDGGDMEYGPRIQKVVSDFVDFILTEAVEMGPGALIAVAYASHSLYVRLAELRLSGEKWDQYPHVKEAYEKAIEAYKGLMRAGVQDIKGLDTTVFRAAEAWLESWRYHMKEGSDSGREGRE
jgi:hypothetical protein